MRLDLIVEEAVERARRHSPDTPFDVELDQVVLTGEPGRLGRAINNLLDNAVNYSPPGSPVEIALHGQRAHGARPRARASQPPTSPMSSTASTAAPRRADARARGLVLRSCARSPNSTAAASAPRRARRRHADAPASPRRRPRCESLPELDTELHAGPLENDRSSHGLRCPVPEAPGVARTRLAYDLPSARKLAGVKP